MVIYTGVFAVGTILYVWRRPWNILPRPKTLESTIDEHEGAQTSHNIFTIVQIFSCFRISLKSNKPVYAVISMHDSTLILVTLPCKSYWVRMPKAPCMLETPCMFLLANSPCMISCMTPCMTNAPEKNFPCLNAPLGCLRTLCCASPPFPLLRKCAVCQHTLHRLLTCTHSHTCSAEDLQTLLPTFGQFETEKVMVTGE